MTPRETQMAVENLIPRLAEMHRQGKFGQWVSYLLEAIESDIGKDALDEARRVLEERYQHGRW